MASVRSFNKKLLISGALLFVPLFEVTPAVLNLSIVDWFWRHVELMLAVIITGIILSFFRKSRRLSYLFLSSGVFAALGGASAYTLYPIFLGSAPGPAADVYVGLANALADVLGPIFVASIAISFGLVLGWLPAWLYLRAEGPTV